MADTKITALAAITTVDPAVDVLPIVDVSDTSMAASGTTKKITSNQILGAGGTATLASATITGDLTVDTSTLKVDSTNNRVGIGTATPGFALDILGASGLGIRIYESSTGNNNRLQITQTGTDSTFNSTYSAGSGAFAWQIASAELMRLNSTGLGIGVTPSAWGGSFKAFQIGSVNSLAAFSQNLYLSANWYNGAGDKYIANGLASQYAQSNGTHAWFTASNNTLGAGATCTFTQAMTLDASGNLLVGTTSSLGSSSNSTRTVGGVFVTAGGSTASTASGSAVTLFTAPNEAVFMVSAYIFGTGSPSAYNAVAIVKVSGGSATITTISSATGISVSLSGLNVQATQTSGSSQVIAYSAIRIS